MSGSEGERRPTEPLDFTDAEVKELAGRRAKPVAAASRIKKLVPTDVIGRLASDLPQPARISRDELATMRRVGRRPEKIVARLQPSEIPAEELDPRKDLRRPGPTRKPPHKG